MKARLGMAFLVGAICFNAVEALAIVDMANGNYSETWEDIELGSISLARTYNSRSAYNGLFGYGWCTDFETSLAVQLPGQITVTECGAGMEI